MKLLLKKIKGRYNLFILAVLFLLGFSLLYFLYFRQRNQAEVYVGLSVTRGINIPISGPYNWVPYWLADAISAGDKEISPLGGLNAEVLDKESYEASFYGKYVYLLLKINAIKDRSGIYLFKNKPLSVGAMIDLKLTKAQIQGLVTYVGDKLPEYEFNKLKVALLDKAVDAWVADNLRVGSAILNNKGQVIVKVLDKKVTFAEVRVNTADGQAVVSYDRTKRDLEVTIELLTKKIDEIYYYAETQKVNVNESLFLPFKEVSLNLPILSVNEISETQ